MALGDKERAKELIDKSSSETVKYFEQETRQIHLAKDGKDGESVAFLELPKYVDEEIKKSIDINVDELVKNRKDLPDVVLRSLYDEVVADLAAANSRIEILEGQVADLTAQLASMTAQRDNEREQRIAAEMALAELENLYIALSDQFQDTTLELQRAIERSTQEAVERVSLEARFEAIKARLAASLLAIEITEEQLETEQAESAAQIALEGRANSFARGSKAGYKMGLQNDIKNDTYQVWIKTENDDDVREVQGLFINCYNFESEEQTVTISKNTGDTGWITLPSTKTMTLPAREDDQAGVGYFGIKLTQAGSTSPRKKTLKGTLKLVFSGGDTFELKCGYWKEVRRRDKWGSRGTAQTRVGQEKV